MTSLFSGRRDPLLAATLAALALTAALMFPGDAPFLNDEPLLLGAALKHNAAGTLARVGLLGTVGLRYGPVPIWVYQAGLAVTHDLVTLVSLRAALFMLVTAWALLALARRLELGRSAVLLSLTSPYLWLYARLLWDNSLAIPLGAVATLAYVRWRKQQEPWVLAGLGLCLCTLPLIHPMTLALVVPTAVATLVASRHAPRRVVAVYAALGLVALALWVPYVLALEALPTHPVHRARVDGWFFPLLGFRLLSSAGFAYFFDTQWGWREPLFWLGIVTAALAAIGFSFGLWGAAQAARQRAVSVRRDVARLLLGIVAVQILLDGVSASAHHPHYYNGTWVIFPLLFAWGVVTLPRVGRVVLALLVFGLPLSTGIIIARLHLRHGTRGPHYGATLANQLEVAAALNSYAEDSPVAVGVDNIQRFPHALALLRRLTATRPNLPAQALQVVYTSPEPTDGHVGVAPVDLLPRP